MVEVFVEASFFSSKCTYLFLASVGIVLVLNLKSKIVNVKAINGFYMFMYVLKYGFYISSSVLANSSL